MDGKIENQLNEARPAPKREKKSRQTIVIGAKSTTILDVI